MDGELGTFVVSMVHFCEAVINEYFRLLSFTLLEVFHFCEDFVSKVTKEIQLKTRLSFLLLYSIHVLTDKSHLLHLVFFSLYGKMNE